MSTRKLASQLRTAGRAGPSRACMAVIFSVLAWRPLRGARRRVRSAAIRNQFSKSWSHYVDIIVAQRGIVRSAVRRSAFRRAEGAASLCGGA